MTRLSNINLLFSSLKKTVNNISRRGITNVSGNFRRSRHPNLNHANDIDNCGRGFVTTHTSSARWLSSVATLFGGNDAVQSTTRDQPTQSENEKTQYFRYLAATDKETEQVLLDSMTVIHDFLSETEEQSLLDEIEPYMQRLHYENDHWDDAIVGYRETERKHWRKENKVILQRLKDKAFSSGSTSLLQHVHILDLEKNGYIKAHVDAVRFCGNTIAGVSLLSSCVMRLVNTENKEKYGDILLNRRSLYIMRDAARYNFTHEVLKESESVFRGEIVPRDRRISVICRNEATQT
ncbi:hypothetical protein ScPMuIL_005826 [Solemya velum]